MPFGIRPVFGHLLPVRLRLKLICAALVCLAGFSAQAAHTQVRLMLAADTARAGDTVLAGVELKMDPHWHTYWKNPGGAGIPTKIQWKLPAGVSAGAIQWPVPQKLPDKDLIDLTTYIYTDEVILLIPLKLASDLQPGPLELKAKVSWLECDVQCVPGNATVQATLNLGAEAKASKDAALLASWQRRLPQPGGAVAARAWWEKPAAGDSRPLLLEWTANAAAGEADFFPDSSPQFEVQPTTESLPAEAGKIRLRKEVKTLSGDWPAQVSGVLVQGASAARTAYEVNLSLGAPRAAATPEASSEAAAPRPAFGLPSLWKLLLYGFVGGLILNVMPCVLPVIALKILGFVGQAKDQPRQVRKLGLIYAFGVLVSFLVLAALVIGLKAAGHKVGWGFQFSNPQFLVVLTVLITLVALNLFGLFEVNLGGRVMDAAGTLASKHGPAGAFFNGVLATVLATPCTAPILAQGVGLLSSQSAPIIVLIFLSVGLGLAAPYLILSWQPAWLKLLPKSGAWMERFKIAMGFPMLATAFWLLSLIPIYYGERAWWLGIFLVIVAFAAWIFGQFVQRGKARRSLALAMALGLLVAGYAVVIEGQLRWRAPLATAAADSALKNDPEGIQWRPWTPAALAAARATGRPVLVDFTARWCVTCNTIVKPALESELVRNEVRTIDAVPLLGDYTRFPDAITDELNRYGRSGVPLVLVYPKNPNDPPEVFDVVTPSTVLKALERAAR